MVGAYIQFVRNLEALGMRKRGRPPVFNANQFYPFAIERELQQITSAEFQRALEEYIRIALQGEKFGDTLEDLLNNPSELPKDFKGRLPKITAAMSAKVTADFARQSEMTVGQPYYPPAAKDDIFKTWEQNFQQLCVSAESDAKKEISRIVSESKQKGWNARQTEVAIREHLPDKFKYRAELIARTEIGKLNSAARLSQFKEIGIEYYKWMTTCDGRERENHRKLNNVICSVSDPTVYFEETPEGLVKKSRNPATMFIGNPGEDFQCRCSMVSWCPEIDGKYKVAGPTQEEIAAAEAKARAKAEKAAREAAEKAAREEAERLAREEAERKAREEAERKLAILRKANERHAARTDKQAADIRAELQRRLNIREDLRKAMRQVEGIPDIDTAAAAEILHGAGTKAYAKMEMEAKNFYNIVTEIQGLTRLENPMEVAKQWGYQEAKNVQANVERTLARWAGSSLDEQKQKLEYEIQWVEDNKKYKTWKVAQDAYKKELRAVEYKIKWEKPDQDLAKMLQMLGVSKSKAAADAIAELQAARNADDLPRFEKALKKAESVYNKLHAKKLGKKAPAATSNTSGDHAEYEGTDLSWSRHYFNNNTDRDDFTKNLLIEDVLQDQGFMNFPKLVDITEFRDLLKKDHYLATRTYGTENSGEVRKLTIEAREGLYRGDFYVKCQGWNAHGFGMYFGCDPNLGKQASINKGIVRDYKKTHSYEEFCCLSKGAKVIQEADIEPEFLKRGLLTAPTDRIKKALNDAIKNNGYHPVVEFRDTVSRFSSLTADELKFIKGGFSFWKVIPDSELMKDPSKIPFHKESHDHGVLAAKMGYDALYDKHNHYGVFLNRSKMILLDRQKDTRNTNEIFKQEFGV